MGRWSRLLASQLVSFVEVAEGDAVLDLGCGTGALTVALRDETRAASIVGVDSSPEYIGYARQRAGDQRTQLSVGDARALDFPEATFDRVFSSLALNFVPQPGQVVREMARVAKPSGIIAAAVWDYGRGMEMLRAFWDEAAALDPAAKSIDEGNMPLTGRSDLAKLWRQEGLNDVCDAHLMVSQEFANFADFWSPFLLGQGPAGAYVAGLRNNARAALESRLRHRLLGGGPDHPITLKARAWAVKGSVGYMVQHGQSSRE
ncbi:MAG: methyltransferase domain-containing protein [Polyangiaceae bacterium]